MKSRQFQRLLRKGSLRVPMRIFVCVISLSLLETLFVNCSGGSFATTGTSSSNSSQASSTTSPTAPIASANPMGTTAAARLLNQGTFGATMTDIQNASQMDYDQWFAQQLSATVSLELPYFTTSTVTSVWAAPNYDGINTAMRKQIWLQNALTGQDQLRQRMAFALSEIFVVSEKGNDGFNNGVPAIAGYYDILVQDALGNFRQLLNDVTLNSYMGVWLTMVGNQGTNLPVGVHADENYAREVMQLFTVGLNMLNLDGSNKLDSNGNVIPVYTQAQVEDLARVFTGWGSFAGNSWQGNNWGAVSLLNSTSTAVTVMNSYASEHDSTSKTIINNTVVPAGLTADAEMKIALDTLFNHPNVGPFFCSQIIKKLVTSNPSPAYISRVSSVFNDDGTGVRGNLLAVLKAILTDTEAINGVSSNAAFGRLRESPLKLTHMYRAFNASTPFTTNTGWSALFDADSFSYWPLESVTVFNFYQPNYQPAGLIANYGQIAPEFEIMTDNTIVSVSNSVDFYSGFYQGTKITGIQSSGTTYDGITPVMNLTSWETLAQNPTSLVNEMNLVLMNGTMTADMQAALVTYATSVSNIDQRISDLIDLIINSPQYSIQR